MPDDFEQIVRRHQGAVCAVAYSVLRDRARSEEIAQEAFLVAWQKLPAMDPQPLLPAWICGIAKKLAANARRRRKEVVMPASFDAASPGTPAVDAMIDRETAAQVTQALGELAEADREVVVLYYRGDQSLADVAAALAITEPAARQRLHRGRERLKDALAVVEAGLRASRPGAAFTAACVAALAVRGTARAEPAKQFPVKPIAIGVAALALVGAAVWFARTPSAKPVEIRDETHGSGSSRDARVGEAARPEIVRRLDPTARAALADLLVRRGARVTSSKTPPTGPGGITKVYDFSGGSLADPPVPPVDGPLNKTTIRAAIRAMQPMLVECFAASTRGGTGTLAVTLHLSGAAETPTLVDAVDLEGPPIASADTSLVECLRETLTAIELPAMDAVENWDVHYPLVR